MEIPLGLRSGSIAVNGFFADKFVIFELHDADKPKHGSLLMVEDPHLTLIPTCI
jgi:hypothetical protein